MSASLIAKFDTRREAEMTVERLVQQFEIQRTDIFIAAEGNENTAGVEEGGADTEADAPSPGSRDDAKLTGRVVVSVDLEDDGLADEVRSAFAEFDAAEIKES